MPEGEFQARYHPLFHTDVLSASNWYDRHKLGLGFDFLECVETATRNLASDPYRRSSIDYGLRYWPISRFPFVVFYDIYEREILVLGVMHTAQEHEAWLRRTR
jgi:hypothetical protein